MTKRSDPNEPAKDGHAPPMPPPYAVDDVTVDPAAKPTEGDAPTFGNDGAAEPRG